ncbi:hypothetical protein ISN44_As11g014840 [Arabidopsis suecica]|uniref:Uncharacterized protein n=1 Tax=Arabidopsis suecica TaxID=45249 RepID=A0A8T1Z8T5_ARASU|nr:hypothetical protein ISN44_As11g014840 [Arabidopsis suecica]KAG7555337.1 hypothetical protein ISN44_As11g014840 [Arabidopsis suecica]KAG7555338.1 hypothetical protein ISN44_As11g014840 [Arabidopsis suecica]
MAERVEASSVTEGENTIEEREVGAMWELEQKLDQPMDEEANKLNDMNREKGLSMLMLRGQRFLFCYDVVAVKRWLQNGYLKTVATMLSLQSGAYGTVAEKWWLESG